MFMLPLVMLALLAPGQNATQDTQAVPWPVKLGARALHRSNSIPLIDQVVVVPDTDTYLDEMAHWSSSGQWPILIEDDHLAPMFIRRLKPARVVKRASVKPPDMPVMDRFELVLSRSWGAAPGESLEDAMARQGIEPLGLVLTSPTSTAWPAALALAVGRGQAVAMLDGRFGGGGTILAASKAAALAALVRQRAEETGLTWKTLGDQIDAITICRNLPARARFELPATARVQVPNVGADEPLAITDVLGRRQDGHRYAIVGWINGDEVESAYIAMCSLFLTPDTAWLCNGYPQDGQWLRYAVKESAAVLAQAGFDCTVIDNASIDGWRAESSGGLDQDLLVVNSKGNKDFFNLLTGRGTPDDIPLLATPAVLQMVHSWSLVDPSNAHTVGGRWLEHGVYAYIGSSHEPFLSAFVPPSEFVRRLTMLVPFLAAGRWWEEQGPLSRAWRVNTLGDPLMTVGPPELSSRPRVEPWGNMDATTRGIDVREDVEQLMRGIAENPSSGRLKLTLRALNLLGEDDLARQMWVFGNQQHLVNAEAASIALGPLFRLQDRAAFAKVYPLVSRPTRLQRDMLWQLLGPSLAASTDDAVLSLLESQVSGPTPSGYIEILGPHLSRRYGNPRVMNLIQRASRSASGGQEKQRLQALLRQYSTGR